RVADVEREEILDALDVLDVDQRLEVDHAQVAPALEVARLVEDIGDAARHAGGEIAPDAADDHHPAARHVLAAVVPGAFHHGEGAAVPDAEPLPGHAPEVGLAARGAVEDHVADQDIVFGDERRLAR